MATTAVTVSSEGKTAVAGGELIPGLWHIWEMLLIVFVVSVFEPNDTQQ